MLNDFFSVARDLESHRISLERSHPDVKDMAKGPALRVRLNAVAAVVGIEIVPDAGRGMVWTLRDGQHNGFPGLKSPALLRLDRAALEEHERTWKMDKSAGARRAELLRLLSICPFNDNELADWPSPGHRQRIRERVDALRPMANDPLTAAVPATFDRFLASLDASLPFLVGLKALIEDRICSRGDDWLDPAARVLTVGIMLVIDVQADEFARDASDRRQRGAVSYALSAPTEDTSGQNSNGTCALSGSVGKLHTGNFPQPNLPGLGQTYVFSRNKDIPSLARYGRCADASFRVDSDLVQTLSGAIEMLTRDGARGKTWRLIPAEKGDKPDLLVASLLEPDVRLVDDLAGDEDEEETGGGVTLTELPSRVIGQSQGRIQHVLPQQNVRVLILRTVDPANRKAIYHRNTTSTALWEAARRWADATGNTPAWLGFPCPVKGQPHAALKHPMRVAPLSIIKLSRIQFTNAGTRRVEVVGVPAAQAFALYLHESDYPRCARSLLHLVLQRHGGLVTGVAAARLKGLDYLKHHDAKADLRRDALRSITWIGALLYHLDRLKEVYMSDAAFRLGQLLQAADVLHIGYCADLRGGDVPPSLIGNSVLTVAGANPVRALAILESRLKPYLAWAKRDEHLLPRIAKLKTENPQSEEQKKGNRLSYAISSAFYSAPRLKELITDLRTVLNTQVRDDTFKAELLLGYIAGLPPTLRKTPNGPGTETDPSKDSQNGGNRE